MRSRASSHHMRMSHTGPNTHPPEGRGGGARGAGDGGENVQRAVSAASEKKRQPRQSAPKGAGDPGLTQALAHGRRGPHTWALGDCCTLGRCPSTHTPHTTPHAHTLGQHIGYEEGHPPTQGPHQQSMSRETGAGRWEEVGVDARGHCDAWAGTRESTRSLTMRHSARWSGNTGTRSLTPQHITSTPRWRWRCAKGSAGALINSKNPTAHLSGTS